MVAKVGELNPDWISPDYSNRNILDFGGSTSRRGIQPINGTTDWASMNDYSFGDIGGASTGVDVAGKVPYEASFSDKLFGYQNPDTGYKFGGYAAPILSTATAGMNAYLGLQQLNLMKDTLAFQKDAFSKQFENQRTTTNTQLADRQNARNASGSGYESTDSYMKNHVV